MNLAAFTTADPALAAAAPPADARAASKPPETPFAAFVEAAALGAAAVPVPQAAVEAAASVEEGGCTPDEDKLDFEAGDEDAALTLAAASFQPAPVLPVTPSVTGVRPAAPEPEPSPAITPASRPAAQAPVTSAPVSVAGAAADAMLVDAGAMLPTSPDEAQPTGPAPSLGGPHSPDPHLASAAGPSIIPVALLATPAAASPAIPGDTGSLAAPGANLATSGSAIPDPALAPGFESAAPALASTTPTPVAPGSKPSPATSRPDAAQTLAAPPPAPPATPPSEPPPPATAIPSVPAQQAALEPGSSPAFSAEIRAAAPSAAPAEPAPPATSPTHLEKAPSAAASGSAPAASAPAAEPASPRESVRARSQRQAALAEAAALDSPSRSSATASAAEARPVFAPAAAPSAPTPANPTAPLVAATAPLPLDAPEIWVSRLADEVGLLASGPVRSTRLKLRPAALGDLQLSVELEKDRVRVAMTVATPAAHAIVTRDLDQLTLAAAQQGLTLDHVTLELGSQASGQSSQHQDQSGRHGPLWRSPERAAPSATLGSAPQERRPSPLKSGGRIDVYA